MKYRMPTALALCLMATPWIGAQEVNVAGNLDSPQWRGPLRNGVYAGTGLLKSWPKEGPKLLWSTRTVNDNAPMGNAYSSVSVAKGRVYTIGQVRKRQMQGCYVFCLDDATGKLIWKTRIAKRGGGQPNSTPTVDGDRVYALDRTGQLVCLKAKTGEVVWQVHYTKDLGGRMMSGWGYSESVLIDGDRLICTPGGDQCALAALDKYSGKLIWKAAVSKAGGAGYASIVTATVGGVKQYITWMGRSIVSVRARDGGFQWRYSKVANGTANIPTAIVKDNYVFCTTGYGGGGSALLKMTLKQGNVEVEEVYHYNSRKLQNHHGGLILVGDYIYGGHGHNNGMPFCLHMKTGKIAWGPERGAGERSAAVVYADGHIYYRYQDGTMALVKATPKEYKLVSRFELPPNTGTPSWPHPVIANGKLYIRGRDVVLCYDLRAK